MFNHIPIQTPVIETAHTDNGHFYSINGEKYPSITTILHSFPNPGIEIWKAKTPNWKEIQEESFRVGTDLHHMIEKYLKNDPNFTGIDDFTFNLFRNLIPELEKIDNIRCQETHLYEPNLKVAGCVDCIAEYDGELCVIDFKNSRKPKKEWMVKKSGYYEQVTAYSKMFQYCTNHEINTGLILIASWDGSISKHKIHIPDYEENLINILEQYYEL